MGQIPALENISSSGGPEHSLCSAVSFTYLQQHIKGQINFLQKFIPNFFHVASSIFLQSMTVPHKSAFSLWVFERKL